MRIYLKEFRKRSNLTLDQAHQRGAASPQTLNKWERGQHSPTVADLIRLAEVYGVHPSDFFFAPRDVTRGNIDYEAIRHSALIAGIHPLAFVKIEGDFSRLQEADFLGRMLERMDRLKPEFLEHLARLVEGYPKQADIDDA